MGKPSTDRRDKIPETTASKLTHVLIDNLDRLACAMLEGGTLADRLRYRLHQTFQGLRLPPGYSSDAIRKKTLLSRPLEDDLQGLIITASSLEDIWGFFLRRLKNGSPPDLICFSVLDGSEKFIRVRFLEERECREPSHKSALPAGEDGLQLPLPSISLSEPDNHLIHAYHRKDTTFSPALSRLGKELLACLPQLRENRDMEGDSFNLFSIPFIAGDKTIALLTIGFQDMDAFSQAKLSYVYGLRDPIAQLVWNLILRDRLNSQTQVDNLTGLLGYTHFQDVLVQELTVADQNFQSVTVMVMDIDQIQVINREQGHAAGDEAICHLATTVRRLMRGVDTVARYGGDEIVVVLPDTGRSQAIGMAQRFLDGLQASLPAHLRTMSVSVGHATYPDDTKSRGKLLKLADQALHLAQYRQGQTQGEQAAMAGVSNCVAASEMDSLNEQNVVEIFASQVAKKYEDIHVPGIYQELLNQIASRQQGGSQHMPQHEETPSALIVKADDLMLETITSLAGALDAKDRYTRGHSQAVANYAVALAHALGMSPAEVEEIRAAGFLHDIGKIGIPETILCKNGPLNEKEWEIMKQHAVIGAQQILHPVKVLRPLIPAVECHHENWDGSGHPHGYKGEKIPVGARIIAIVDAFHALTSDRSYRKALPVAQARQILEANSGRSWDPHLLEVFFGMLSQAAPRPMEPGNTQPVDDAVPIQA